MVSLNYLLESYLLKVYCVRSPRTSSRAGWLSWSPCSWCLSTSSTTSPPTRPRLKVRCWQSSCIKYYDIYLGLTAIEIWMLSCILFVFGALIGDINPPVCSWEMSSLFHSRVCNYPLQKTNQMYKSQENPEQQLSGDFFLFIAVDQLGFNKILLGRCFKWSRGSTLDTMWALITEWSMCHRNFYHEVTVLNNQVI